MVRLATATCAVVVILGAFCVAQESGKRPSQRIGMLVLRNGRVVTGQITPRAGGYDIRKGPGRMFVASDTVRFEADNMAEAYRKFRDTFRELTPEVHLSIARWCVTNNQISSARRELLDALHLDPNNTTARSMLKKLESHVIASQPKPPPKTLAQRRMDQFLRSDHESLGGLTDAQAGTFVSRVQPILERRCGNTGCHGSGATGEFSLKRTRGRSSRLIAERNLAAVLKQIDLRHPEKSPLLHAIDKPHTRDGRSVMPGPSGTVQRRIVFDWVHSLEAASPASETKTASVTQPTPDRKSVRGPMQTTPLSTAEQAIVDEAKRASVRDPFDPTEFNRIHHGVQSRPAGADRR